MQLAAQFAPTEVSNGEQVASVTLGSITYIDASLGDVWPAWLHVLRELLERPWASQLRSLRRSDYPYVSAVDPSITQAYLQELSRAPKGKAQWAGELSDGSEFPSISIEYRDLRPSHQGTYPRTSYVRVRLPLDTEPSELLWISRLLGNHLPINQGVAGYLCHIAGRCRGLSSDQGWAWARRYYGLHLVDPVSVTWDAPHGICGTNWVTLLGNRWFEEGTDPGPAALARLNARAHVEGLHYGQLIQAGTRPLLGDQNRGEGLHEYAEVARAVEAGFIEEPTQYLGMFTDLECTEVWLRRLNDPVAWRDCSQ